MHPVLALDLDEAQSADRLPVLEVAPQAGVSRTAVRRRQQRCAEEGVEGLLRDPSSGTSPQPPFSTAKPHGPTESDTSKMIRRRPCSPGQEQPTIVALTHSMNSMQEQPNSCHNTDDRTMIALHEHTPSLASSNRSLRHPLSDIPL